MRKLIYKIVLAFCVPLGLFNCAQKQKFVSYSPAEFERIIKEGGATIQLVDVRRQDEYAAGHINEAILIDVLDSTFVEKAKMLLDKSKPVAVYCRSGRRSKEAATLLIKQGYKVYELDQGFNGWIEYKQNLKR
jgi:rhodanese-related sulfurtransferase